MKSYIVLLVLALLAFGCIGEERMYVCDDGETVVYSKADCPPYDEEYEECADMPLSAGYYYDSPRDECFYELAIKREDVSLCNKILSTDEYDTYNRGGCGATIAFLKGNATECEGLTTFASRDCYAEYAELTEDYTACLFISSRNARDDCLYQFIGYYIVPESWDICEEFDDEDYMYECYYEAAKETLDVSYCDKIQGESYYYDRPSCYGQMAASNSDLTICGKLADKEDRNGCYSYYADYIEDLSVCYRIEAGSSRDNCLYQFTNWWFSPGSWDFCDDFNDTDYKDECYYEAASDTYDLSYCDKISDEAYYYDRSYCYYNIAWYSDDPSICDRLTTTEEKDDCYYEYATDYPYSPEVCQYITSEYLKDECLYWADDYY